MKKKIFFFRNKGYIFPKSLGLLSRLTGHSDSTDYTRIRNKSIYGAKYYLQYLETNLHAATLNHTRILILFCSLITENEVEFLGKKIETLFLLEVEILLSVESKTLFI